MEDIVTFTWRIAVIFNTGLLQSIQGDLFSPSVLTQQCEDQIDCSGYDIRTSCCGRYEAWARYNCPVHCKFCTPSVTTPRPCSDNIDYCDELGDDLCTSKEYEHYVAENCAGYCRLCEKPPFYPACSLHQTLTSSTQASTNQPVTVSDRSPPINSTKVEQCVDQRDCSGYDIRTSCCGRYEAWARYNCPVHCKFCTPSVTTPRPCTDTIPNCQEYGDELCTDVKYEHFVETKCAAFCKLCETTYAAPISVSHRVPSRRTKSPQTTSSQLTSIHVMSKQATSPTTYTSSQHQTSSVTEPQQRTSLQTTSSHQTTSYLNSPTSPYARSTSTKTTQESTTLQKQTSDKCSHGGEFYPVGGGWYTEHCLQWCECLDPPTNNIRCGPKKCPPWTKGCDLVFHHGECCPTLICPDTIVKPFIG